MIIVLGISEQEDFHQPEIPLERTRKIYNEARLSKKAEIKRAHNSARHPAKLSNILDLPNKVIDYETQYGEWKIQLTMQINFISFKDSEETCTMHTKSDNI